LKSILGLFRFSDLSEWSSSDDEAERDATRHSIQIDQKSEKESRLYFVAEIVIFSIIPIFCFSCRNYFYFHVSLTSGYFKVPSNKFQANFPAGLYDSPGAPDTCFLSTRKVFRCERLSSRKLDARKYFAAILGEGDRWQKQISASSDEPE
jgi:hypothetical protein